MNKKELIDIVSLKKDLTKKDAEALVDTVFDTMIAVSYTHLTLPTNREVYISAVAVSIKKKKKRKRKSITAV